MYDFVKDQVTSKPIDVPDVVKMKTAKQEFRDLQRKTAVEKAKRDALKPDGTLDGNKLRTSLISQGFGENADELVNAVAKEREAALELVSQGKRRDMMDIGLGISTPEQVSEYRNNSFKVTEKSPTTDSYDLTKDPDIPGNNVPMSNSQERNLGENEVLVTGSVYKPQGMKLPEMPTQEYSTSTTPAQISPHYLATNTDWSKFVPGSSSEGSAEKYAYKLPSDKKDRDLAIKTAELVLGTRFDANDPDVESKIDKAATLRAETEVAKVVPSGYKDLFELQKARADRPALVEQKKAEYLKDFEAGRSSRIGQDLTRRSTETGERAQALTEKKAEPLFPEKNIKLSKIVTESELNKINNILPAYDDVRAARNEVANAKGNYLPAVYKLAAAHLRAQGQPVTNESINTYIVGSGIIPNADELQLKNTITSTTPYTDLLTTEFFNKTGLGKSSTKPDLGKIDVFLENIAGDFYSSGGNPAYLKMSPAERELRGKSGKKKEDQKATKRSSEGM